MLRRGYNELRAVEVMGFDPGEGTRSMGLHVSHDISVEAGASPGLPPAPQRQQKPLARGLSTPHPAEGGLKGLRLLLPQFSLWQLPPKSISLGWGDAMGVRWGAGQRGMGCPSWGGVGGVDLPSRGHLMQKQAIFLVQNNAISLQDRLQSTCPAPLCWGFPHLRPSLEKTQAKRHFPPPSPRS